jgi:hypothetical protein
MNGFGGASRPLSQGASCIASMRRLKPMPCTARIPRERKNAESICDDETFKSVRDHPLDGFWDRHSEFPLAGSVLLGPGI